MSVDLLELAKLRRALCQMKIATASVARGGKACFTAGETALFAEATELMQHADHHATEAVRADSDEAIGTAWKLLTRAAELATTAMESAICRDLVVANPGMPVETAMREAKALLHPESSPHRPMFAHRVGRARA